MILARIWPRVAIGAGAAVLLSLAIVNVNRQPNGPRKALTRIKNPRSQFRESP